MLDGQPQGLCLDHAPCGHEISEVSDGDQRDSVALLRLATDETPLDAMAGTLAVCYDIRQKYRC